MTSSQEGFAGVSGWGRGPMARACGDSFIGMGFLSAEVIYLVSH